MSTQYHHFLKSLKGQKLTPKQRAAKWHTEKARLSAAGQLKITKLSKPRKPRAKKGAKRASSKGKRSSSKGKSRAESVALNLAGSSQKHAGEAGYGLNSAGRWTQLRKNGIPRKSPGTKVKRAYTSYIGFVMKMTASLMKKQAEGKGVEVKTTIVAIREKLRHYLQGRPLTEKLAYEICLQNNWKKRDAQFEANGFRHVAAKAAKPAAAARVYSQHKSLEMKMPF